MGQRKIASLLITLAFSLSFAQCERKDIYSTSGDKSFSLLTYNISSLLAYPSGIDVWVGTVKYTPGSTYNFGTVTVGNTSPTVVFTIRNSGSEILTLSGPPIVAIGGLNAADFTATDPSFSTLSPGSSAFYSVSFTPGAIGPRNGVITIQSDDPNRPVYSIMLAGIGSPIPVPDINVRVGSIDYISGSLYDFGTVTVGSSSPTVIFIIQNLGTRDLNLTGFSLGGVNMPEFSVTAPVATLIPSSSSTTFTAIFNPTLTGPLSAVITIQSDDPDEPTYTIDLAGTGIQVPEINIQVASVDYPSGSTYDFGERLIDEPATDTILTIQNTGSGVLTLDGSPLYVELSGANAGDVSITQPGTNTINPGGSTTFGVKFIPSAEAVRTATITIPNNDSDEGTYTINLTATGVMPVMVVNGGNGTNTSVYNPITNTFSTGNPLSYQVGSGAHSFPVPPASTEYGKLIVTHGGGANRFSWYNPADETFTLDATTMPSAILSGSVSFNITNFTYNGHVLITRGGSSDITNLFNPVTNQFEDVGIRLTGGLADTGAFKLPVNGGNILVVCGGGTNYTTLFNQSDNLFYNGPDILSSIPVADGAHAFPILSGSYAGSMMVIPSGGNETRLYNPAGPSFSNGPWTLNGNAGIGAHSIPITSGTHAGWVLIIDGYYSGSPTPTATSLYNPGTSSIEVGPTFPDGDVGEGAFSFAITGGTYKGLYMIVHGNFTNVTTIFNPTTLTFIQITIDDLPNPVASGAHCFPAR